MLSTMWVFALVMVAMSSVCAQTRAVVLVPALNMYSKPNLEADVVSQARYGMTVEILKEDGRWARIATPHDRYEGWSELSPLRRLRAEETYSEVGKIATVTSLYAHLYRDASVTRHRPVVTVPFETRLEVTTEPDADSRRWLHVRTADDRDAYVQRGDVAFDPPALDAPGLIELAKRFMGLPYTWGGTTSLGYDCSGFTQMLCRRGGVDIPRDAKPQVLWDKMRVVDQGDLRPGDLLYFGPSIQKVNHTGFYIGAGEFIHSTTSDHPVIQISNLADEKWTKLLVARRRWK